MEQAPLHYTLAYKEELYLRAASWQRVKKANCRSSGALTDTGPLDTLVTYTAPAVLPIRSLLLDLDLRLFYHLQLRC